ncbi:hypothetical protein SCHPADRAFT_681646 [Schizopora paradoxa]|uniref:Uncharacterized protein n=1 Tax=Schizopora paradoxa TaxID=27342 RepID=A0A0H2R4C1_9AGAM|nr:hypothetical protein SCHPADRAFT_681646 [Schizopora paradoxa]
MEKGTREGTGPRMCPKMRSRRRKRGTFVGASRAPSPGTMINAISLFPISDPRHHWDRRDKAIKRGAFHFFSKSPTSLNMTAPPSIAAPSTPLLKHTLPVFVFFSICGFYFIAYMMIASHAPDRFLEVQKASSVPLLLTNGRFPLVDKILDPLIAFFVAAFGNPNTTAYPTVVDFVWSFGAAIQLPLIEAQRDGFNTRSLAQRALSYPMIWGIFYQRLSGGWILPLWLLAFMHAGSRINGTGIDSAKAESVLFGWWAGHTIPALAMLVPGQPALTSPPVWIAFPILMSLAQSAYLFVRTRVPFFQSKSCPHRGYVCAQLLYLSALVGSAVAHIHVVLIPGLVTASASAPFRSPSLALVDKLYGLARELVAFYTPASGLRVPSPATTTADSGVVHFVQFDVIIVFAAVWTALIWDLALRRRDAAKTSATATTASTETSTLGTFVWVVRLAALLFATAMAVGFGAATAGLLIYRESLMKKARRNSEKESARLANQKPMMQTEQTPLVSYGSTSDPN